MNQYQIKDGQGERFRIFADKVVENDNSIRFYSNGHLIARFNNDTSWWIVDFSDLQ